MIFLPGTDQQTDFLLKTTEIKDGKAVIIGPGTNDIARELITAGSEKVIIIVDDYDSLITMRYRLEKSGEKNIEIRMMEYENTDFHKDFVDLVFAQASVSTRSRNRIIKEIKKILKPGGIFCAGEITKLKEDTPVFIKEIWDSSDLLPLFDKEIDTYYRERGFEVVEKKDLSYTLRDFYRQGEKKLLQEAGDLSDEEKSYYKKTLKKISHESNAYLKLGGSEYMGFSALLMRKK